MKQTGFYFATAPNISFFPQIPPCLLGPLLLGLSALSFLTGKLEVNTLGYCDNG